MAIEIAAFRWAPPFAQGYVRDLRIRWALEEAGFPYETVLIDFEIKETPAYRTWQPFGQVPAYRDGEVEMFESGAIVLYLSEKSEALSPKDAAGRARVMTWVVAALNSVEPHVQNYVHLDASKPGSPGSSPAGPRSSLRSRSVLRSSAHNSTAMPILRVSSAPRTS